LSETIGNVLEELVKDDSSSTDLLFTVFDSKQNISSFIIDIYYKLLNIPNFQKYLENGDEKLLKDLVLAFQSIVNQEGTVETFNHWKNLRELNKKYPQVLVPKNMTLGFSI